MARRAIVTRSISGTELSVLALDVVTAEPQTATYVLSGSFVDKSGAVDEKKALKAVRKAYDTDDFKIVKVVDAKPIRKLYGMWEEDFINQAFELDPATRKPIPEE